MGRGLVLGVSYAPPQEAGPSAPRFGVAFYYAYTLCRRTTEFDVVTHMGGGLILGVSQAPTRRERGPSASKFLGSLPFMHTYFWRWTTKFNVAIHVGRAYFRGHSRLHRKGTGTWHSPIFRVLSIYVYTLCRRTTKFDVVTYKGRVFLLVSHGPSALQFGVFPSIYSYTLCRKTTKFDVGRRVCWGQPRLPSHENGDPDLPNFGGSPAFMPTF